MVLRMRTEAFLWHTLNDIPPDNYEQSIISPPLGTHSFCKHDIQPETNDQENTKFIQNNKLFTGKKIQIIAIYGIAKLGNDHRNRDS